MFTTPLPILSTVAVTAVHPKATTGESLDGVFYGKSHRQILIFHAICYSKSRNLIGNIGEGANFKMLYGNYAYCIFNKKQVKITFKNLYAAIIVEYLKGISSLMFLNN